MPAIDELALHLDRVDFAEGEDDVVQGERGDRFYVIADGEADVIGEGRPIRTLRPGDGFEEIARLHDMLRTTVRAHTRRSGSTRSTGATSCAPSPGCEER